MQYPISGSRLWQWRQTARAEAIAAEISPAEVDWLLQAISDVDRLSLQLGTLQNQPEVLLALPLDELQQRWQQRLHQKIPVQYLVGKTPWRSFELLVSPAVLIPRPETECLIDYVQTAITAHPELKTGHWADLGTGSGAIAIGLADLLPDATIHAVDVSPAALAIARENASRLGVADRIQFHQGAWFEPLAPWRGQFAGILSNPPYIPSQEVLALQPEVKAHEPHLALDGGADGLDCIRHLVEQAPRYLQAGGVWMIEMMAGQADTVQQLLKTQGEYEQVHAAKDLEGIDRFAIAYRRPTHP